MDKHQVDKEQDQIDPVFHLALLIVTQDIFIIIK